MTMTLSIVEDLARTAACAEFAHCVRVACESLRRAQSARESGDLPVARIQLLIARRWAQQAEQWA